MTIKKALLDAVAEAERGQDPVTYNEAVTRPEAPARIEAINKELAVLHKNKTWKIVPLPAGRKPISCKWLFKTKYKADGSLDKKKARLVVKGFSQREGEDFGETFSPVLRLSSFWFLVALAAQFDYHLHQMNVQSAFLHGYIEEEIYMELPEGFEVPEHQRNFVCRLIRALYVLKY